MGTIWDSGSDLIEIKVIDSSSRTIEKFTMKINDEKRFKYVLQRLRDKYGLGKGIEKDIDWIGSNNWLT